MPAYLFVNIHQVVDEPKMEEYRKGVFATVAQYGGKYLVIGGSTDLLEGNWRPTFPVVIEFPSMKQARAWYDSPEYKPLLKLRLEATRGDAIFVEGLDVPR